MTFDEAVSRVLKHEGGFVDHPSDPGGATNYGITVAVARSHGYNGPMRALPESMARHIYHVAYWRPMRCDDLPAGARYVALDAAVHSGVRQAALWLQRALGVAADGVIGPRTLAAAQGMDGAELRARMLAQRLRFMTDLKTWGTFGRGWARRIADLMEA
jgi:lysozyme family protein